MLCNANDLCLVTVDCDEQCWENSLYSLGIYPLFILIVNVVAFPFMLVGATCKCMAKGCRERARKKAEYAHRCEDLEAQRQRQELAAEAERERKIEAEVVEQRKREAAEEAAHPHMRSEIAAEAIQRVRSGDVDAYVYVGNYYYDGIGLEKNRAEAYRMWGEGSLKGNTSCKVKLAECYKKGEGTEKNLPAALVLYKELISSGRSEFKPVVTQLENELGTGSKSRCSIM